MKTYSFHYGDQMIDCRLDEKRIIGGITYGGNAGH